MLVSKIDLLALHATTTFASCFMQLSLISFVIASFCGIPIWRSRHRDVTFTPKHATGKKSVRRESRSLRCFIRKHTRTVGRISKDPAIVWESRKSFSHEVAARVFSFALIGEGKVHHAQCGLSSGKAHSVKHSTYKMVLSPSELRQKYSVSIFLSWSLQSLTRRSFI